MTLRRRDFLSVAGLGAVGVVGSVRAAARASGEPYRIDCQNHFIPPDLLSFLEKRPSGPRIERRGDDRFIVVGEWRRRVLAGHLDIRRKLADMDEAGIEWAALSINDPGPELFGAEGPAVARLQNDGIAAAAYADFLKVLETCPRP